jgi:5'-nucleotidase
MKNILITNDDGYESAGLLALVEAVKDLGNVTVVAPATEKSACGHSLTLTKPLRFISVDDDFYKLDDGTPSDCVYLALHSIFENIKPDIVLSGINKGSNLGEDVTYSGTAAGAMEAVLQGVPAIAFSQVYTRYDTKSIEFDFENAKKVARELTKKALDGGFPLGERKFLNVNIPDTPLKGYKIAKLGYRYYGNDAHRHTNPRGEEYFWLGLHPLRWEENSECDFNAIKDGYASITPIQLDLTSHKDIEKMQEWIK